MKSIGRLLGRELLWTAILVAFLWISYRIFIPVRVAYQQEPFGNMGYWITIIIIPILFGALLALPSLIQRWKTGRGFNLVRVIVQGIPALVFAVPALFFMVLFDMERISLAPWERMKAFAPFITYLAGVWFGKVMVDSIKAFEAAGHKQKLKPRPPAPKVNFLDEPR